MTLLSANRHRIIAYGPLLAALIHASTATAAGEVRLFPAPKPAIPAAASQVPAALPSLATPDTAALSEAAPSAGPLRVVIPNIKHAQKKLPVESTEAAPAATVEAAAPVAPVAAESPVSIKQVSSALYEGAKGAAKDAFDNGVMIVHIGSDIILNNVFRPNINFAALPLGWQVAAVDNSVVVEANVQDTAAVANLAPAAGAPTGIVTAMPSPQAAAPSPQAAPAQANIQPQPIAKAPVPIPAPAAAITPAANDTEPAPSLSTQSKVISSKVKGVSDPKEIEAPIKKVDMKHQRESDDVLAKSAAANSDSAHGIKTSTVRPNFDVNYELERAYNALIAGKSDIAIQIYEDILTSNPKNQDALFGLATTYHRAGQIDMARALYGKLLALNPTHRDGLNNFLVLLADEAPQESLAQMEKLEQQNPGFSPIPAQMAIVYQKLGNSDRAIDKMYSALAASPENVTYRYNLAIMLDKNGKYEEAAKLYAQILNSHAKGEVIPGDATKIQQRLTFIRSNNRR